MYTTTEIYNEFLGMLGPGLAPDATKVALLKKALAEAFSEAMTLHNPASHSGSTFNTVYRKLAQFRMAEITDGPGSPRPMQLLQQYEDFVKELGEDAFADTDEFQSLPWMASYVYRAGDYVVPTLDNGYRYLCSTAGTSGANEPTWPTTVDNTVADNTVTWTCKAALE